MSIMQIQHLEEPPPIEDYVLKCLLAINNGPTKLTDVEAMEMASMLGLFRQAAAREELRIMAESAINPNIVRLAAAKALLHSLRKP